jgi:ribose transport system ATP-binding protein
MSIPPASAIPAPRQSVAPRSFAARGLTKRYGPTTVLDDVSFVIPENTVVSFVGENGAGKSTLLNILSGIVRADQGAMRFGSADFAPSHYGAALGAGLSRVFQEQSLVQNIPVYENIVLGHERFFDRTGQFVDRGAMIAAAERIVAEAGLEVDVRRRTGSYPFSTRQSIEIARACLAPLLIGGRSDPLVLLDEPTSALDRRDEEAFFRLIERMRKVGSLIFVSHRLTEVLGVSDRIVVLKDGRVVATLAARETSEAELHELMIGRERAVDYYHERRQRIVASEAPPVLSVEVLSRPGEYQEISLSIQAGEIVGIGGLLDSGKSALGRGVAGVEAPASGRIVFGGEPPERPDIKRLVRRGLGYVPAERLAEGLIPEFSLAWNMGAASGGDMLTNPLGFWRVGAEIRIAERFVRELSIRSGSPRQIAARLSGGNQQKVVLGRWLARDLKVLILDNPTRGVDAGAKEEIYQVIRGLAETGVAVLLITDELLELIGLSNRILVMQRGRIAAEVPAPAAAKPTERDLIPLMLPQGAAAPAPGRPLSPTISLDRGAAERMSEKAA